VKALGHNLYGEKEQRLFFVFALNNTDKLMQKLNTVS